MKWLDANDFDDLCCRVTDAVQDQEIRLLCIRTVITCRRLWVLLETGDRAEDIEGAIRPYITEIESVLHGLEAKHVS